MTQRLATLVSALLLVTLGLGWSFLQSNPVGVDMTRAANKFLDTLADQEKATAQLDFDTPKRVNWHFVPKSERKGLQIRDMSETQRDAAHGLLRAALSQTGYDKTVKIMALEHILHALEKKREGGNIRDQHRYYFTVFGKPLERGRWALSVEGHHLSLNFVVENGKVISSTPSFMGANPALVKNDVSDGLPKGTRVLAKEEVLAFELLNLLSDEQLGTAVLSDKPLREIRAAGSPQPPQDAPVGVAAGDMTRDQRVAFRTLVESYLDNMPEEVRQARIDAIMEAGPDNVHFAWAGAKKPGVGHYYRVQGPSFLIEFVNTQPDAAGNPANHIHCVWRDMNGDFAVPME